VREINKGGDVKGSKKKVRKKAKVQKTEGKLKQKGKTNV